MSVGNTILGPGDALAGFEIEDVIGIGGMAIVYRAEQTSLRRKVALKVLSPELTADPEFRERFRREGQHVAALDHPHVVTIHDSGEADGHLYLAMRLVEGVTLAQRMVVPGLSASDTIAILTPIAQALDAAHALGLVHRDVKPQNMLLTDADVPYLADFGVARLGTGTTALTDAGLFVGTVSYAPPEQISGVPPTAAGDIYALTAVLYQCLTGQVPYPRDTDVAVMRAHLDEPPPQIDTLSTDCKRLDEIIARGMAKAPGERYARASALLSDAADVLSVLPLWRRHSVPAFPAGVRDKTLEATVTRQAMWAPPPDPDTDAQASSATVMRPLLSPLVGTQAESPASAPPVAEPTEPAPPVERPAPTTTNRRDKHPHRLVLVGGLVVTAATIGGAVAALGVGGVRGSKVAATRTVSFARAGVLELSYRYPWSPTTASLPGSIALDQPVELRSKGITILAGSSRTVASVPGTLPAAIASGAAPPTAEPTHLGVYASDLYTWTTANGYHAQAWVIPTATGDVTLVCEGSGGTATALQACASVARTARLTGVSNLPPGPDVGFAASVRSALAVPAGAAISGLASRVLRARASAAARMAHVDRLALTRLRAVATPPRYARVAAVLEQRVAREAAGFAALADAAKAGSRSRYAEARRRAIRARRQLARAVRSLRGYDLGLATPAPLELPGLPGVHKAPSSPASSSTPSAQPRYTPPATPAPPASRQAAPPPAKAPAQPAKQGGLVTAKPLS